MAVQTTATHTSLAWLALSIGNLLGNGLGANWACIRAIREAPAGFPVELVDLLELFNGKFGQIDIMGLAVFAASAGISQV